MFDKMKQLMEMKKQAERIKSELDLLSIEYNDVKGINIVINGSLNFQSVEINEDFLTKENKGNLETELLRSLNGAVSESQKIAAQKMKDVMPGFPGM